MKKRTHYTKFVEGKWGWSQWQWMSRKTHLACCDCGLVHTIQFDIEPSGGGFVIYARFRRAKGRTAARRKQVKHAFVAR